MNWPDELDADEYRKYLSTLGVHGVGEATPEELAQVHQILGEMSQEGSSPTFTGIVEDDFAKPPPSIQEFMEDDYYLGSVCKKTENSQGIYPKWRDTLYELFDPTKTYRQLILSGAIGLGKSWCASIAILYKLARCLCMRSPLDYFGLRATNITFNYFSVTQAQVKGGTFADTILMMSDSPFFAENIKDNAPNRKYADRKIEFIKNLKLEAGSKIQEAIGRNTLCSLIDEVNFRLEKEASKAAAALFSAIDRRYKSRFRHTNEGLIILMSSAKSEDDFLAEHIKKYRHDPNTLICDFPWWEVVGPHRINYSGKKFFVDIGDALNPPVIIKEEEKKEEIPTHRLLEVPVEHLEEFELDPEGSIRDIAGISTGRIAKLFPNLFPLINTIADGCENPFRVETAKLSLESTHTLVDYLNNGGKGFITTVSNRPQPLRHPGLPRYIHIDVSTGSMDALGISMIHPVARVKVERTNQISQLREEMYQPIFELDFALRIIRERADDPIDFSKLRSFIYWLKKCNFKIKRVSCDLQLLSHEMRAILKKMGFDAIYLSMDKTKAGYEVLRHTILEGRLRAFQHNYFILEAANLENGSDKVDHPSKFNIPWKPMGDVTQLKGSKDVADSIGGSIYNAVLDIDDISILPMVESLPQRMLTAIEHDGKSVGKYDEGLRHHIGMDAPVDTIYTID